MGHPGNYHRVASPGDQGSDFAPQKQGQDLRKPHMLHLIAVLINYGTLSRTARIANCVQKVPIFTQFAIKPSNRNEVIISKNSALFL